MTEPDIEQIKKALPLVQHHRTEQYKKRLDWIKTTITILTPSLVLLIGLQDKSQQAGTLSQCLLLTSVLMLTLTILIGLLSLLGESTGHQKAAGDIKEWVDSGKDLGLMKNEIDFPWYHNFSLKIFPLLSFLSILFLGAFGILKYL